jgi:hypothetical protein
VRLLNAPQRGGRTVSVLFKLRRKDEEGVAGQTPRALPIGNSLDGLAGELRNGGRATERVYDFIGRE